MEGRTRKAGHGSPERSKTRTEAALKHLQHSQPHQQLGRKIPVVYYLCRNRHLEHPHFIEVPTSSPEGLYLRDVIGRLNVLRGKGMAVMYSWSCKRSYKNGFVWHDLSEDDLILPSNGGNEYVLKGSELLLDTSPSDRPHPAAAISTWSQTAKHLQQEPPLPTRSLETSPSSSGVVVKEVKPPPQQQHPSLPPTPPPAPGAEDELQLSPTLRRRSFSSRNISPDSQLNPAWGVGGCSPPGLAEYKVYKANAAADASTQTEDKGGPARPEAAAAPPPCTRTMGVSTDDGMVELDFDEARQLRSSSEISGDEISPPPASSSASSSGGKAETLESLIRADARKMRTFRILEEEEVVLPPAAGGKLRATNVLMQLITCGSISVKDHHSFGLVPTYKPSFSQVRFPSPVLSSSRILGELECLSENPRMAAGFRVLEDKEYFSGSLIETKKHKELAEAALVPALKRSSSYNADRSCKSPDPMGDKTKATTDSARSKCLPRTIKITSNKHPKNETMKSPISDGPRISSAGPDGTRSRGGSKRFNDVASLKGSSLRLESFREDKEKVIKIEERLTSGARVVIHSTAPCEDSEDSSSS